MGVSGWTGYKAVTGLSKYPSWGGAMWPRRENRGGFWKRPLPESGTQRVRRKKRVPTTVTRISLLLYEVAFNFY